jgi:hypothetical protein
MRLCVLYAAGVDHLPLPWGAMEHAFPQGKLLPFLTELCIEADSSCSEAVGYWDEEQDDYGYGFMDADGLPAVFAACPSLVSLSIRNALQPGDLTPLLQLPATVESLAVGGEAWDDAAAGVVRHLMQLRSVFWEGSEGLTDVGLQQLTALQGLTYLQMLLNSGLSAEVLDDGAHAEDGGSGMLHLVVRPDKVGMLLGSWGAFAQLAPVEGRPRRAMGVLGCVWVSLKLHIATVHLAGVTLHATVTACACTMQV